MEALKRGRGRPKGSVKMTIQRFADNPPLVLPKTDHQRLKELKELMIRSGGNDVAQKVIEIALNDDHPHQLVALKMCLDRTLPVSLFEKDKSQRSAVTINITGLGQEPTIIDTEQPEDVACREFLFRQYIFLYPKLALNKHKPRFHLRYFLPL